MFCLQELVCTRSMGWVVQAVVTVSAGPLGVEGRTSAWGPPLGWGVGEAANLSPLPSKSSSCQSAHWLHNNICLPCLFTLRRKGHIDSHSFLMRCGINCHSFEWKLSSRSVWHTRSERMCCLLHQLWQFPGGPGRPASLRGRCMQCQQETQPSF